LKWEIGICFRRIVNLYPVRGNVIKLQSKSFHVRVLARQHQVPYEPCDDATDGLEATMTTAQKPTNSSAASFGARRMSAGRIGMIVLAGLVMSALLLILFPPVGLIKEQIAEAASKALGRPVTANDMTLSMWPHVSAEISNPAVLPELGREGEFFRADAIKAKLKLWPLLSGKAEVESLELVKPVISLVANADGKGGNWSGLGGAKRSGGDGIAVALLNGATLTDGVVTYTSSKLSQPIAIENLNATVGRDGNIVANGTFWHKGAASALNVSIENGKDAADGQPTPVTLTIDGEPVKFGFKGTATITEAAGDIALTTNSITGLARWIGSTVKPVTPAIPGSLSGKIKASASGIGFENADASMGLTSGRINGSLALNGTRPKFSGTISMPRLDLNGLFLQRASQPGAAPETSFNDDLVLETAPAWGGLLAALSGSTTAKATAAKKDTKPIVVPAATKTSAWSATPIDLKILKLADLDATLEAETVVYGNLDLKKASFKTVLEDGKLNALIHQLSVGTGGSATGKLDLDGRALKPAADFALSMKSVAAEPIISEITGKPLLAGTANVDISAKGEGVTQTELAASLNGKARFQMSKGFIRGFDVRSLVGNWWNSLTGGLKFDIGKQTSFENLDANYEIKRGVMMSSPGLDIGGRDVQVTSRGQVNLPAREINQEIRVKVVPPPAAPPIPVRITGNWSKPNISMDWGDLLFAAGAQQMPADNARTGAPTEAATDFQELAPTPEQVPTDVKAAISNALKSNNELTDEGRALLKSLVEPPVVAPAPEAQPAP
jgi:AsmA protein